MRSRVLVSLAASAWLLAACGGGAGGVTPAPVPLQTAKPAMSGKAVFVVKIPPKLTTGVRTPKYLTANVQGIEFSVTQTSGTMGGYAFYALNSSKSYCTTPSGGGLTCSLPVVATAGTDTIVVNTYDQPNDFAADLISTGSITTTIKPQQSNSINIVTSGIPTFFAMTVDNPFPTTTGAESLHLLPLDADGNVIIGPFDLPITLSNSDTTGSVTLSATSAASSTDTSALTLSFNGALPSVGATIQVQANSPNANWNSTIWQTLFVYRGGSGVIASPSYLVFANASAAGQTITLSGTSAGPYGADTNQDAFNATDLLLSGIAGGWTWVSGCQGIAVVSGASPTFTVTPVHNGFCSLNLYDSMGDHGQVPVVVQSL